MDDLAQEVELLEVIGRECCLTMVRGLAGDFYALPDGRRDEDARALMGLMRLNIAAAVWNAGWRKVG